MPRGEKAPLPKTPAGILVSIADKIDNLLGCFAVGFIPTSSSDPYALRRQALGIIKIIIEQKLHLHLRTVLERALEQFINHPSLNLELKKNLLDFSRQDALLNEILGFIEGRFKTYLVELKFEVLRHIE